MGIGLGRCHAGLAYDAHPFLDFVLQERAEFFQRTHGVVRAGNGEALADADRTLYQSKPSGRIRVTI